MKINRPDQWCPPRDAVRYTLKMVNITAVSFVVSATLLAGPFYVWDQNAAISDLALQQTRRIQLEQSEKQAQTPVQIRQFLQNQIAETALAGVTILNNQFQVVQTLGEPPSTGIHGLRHKQAAIVDQSDPCCIDLFLNMSKSGLPVHIIARIHTGDGPGHNASHYERIVGALLFGLLVASTVSGILLYWRFCRPLYQLRCALPGGRETDIALWQRSRLLERPDMIGELARTTLAPRAIDAIALNPGDNTDPGRDKTPGIFDELIDDIPFAVLSFDASAVVKIANIAALALFGCETIDDLQAMDLQLFTPEDAVDAPPRRLPDLLAGGPLDQLVFVHGRHDIVRARVLSHNHSENAGISDNLVVCLLPVDAPEMGPTALPKAQEELERQILVLKLQLESCLTLLSTPDIGAIKTTAETVRTDIQVEDWYNDASNGNLIDAGMEHDVPGPLLGDSDTVQSILRHALSFIALRSHSDLPILAGSGSVSGKNVVEFLFEEVSEAGLMVASEIQSDTEKHERENSPERWILPLAALTKLLASYGGKVQTTRGQDNRNLISFTLRSKPIDAKELPSGKQKSAA